MATGVINWSKTAASNATADASVNWAEGMAPSAVNDSARAEMASVAKWRDDLNGSITTTGTSTAYAVTSNQGYALTSGFMVAFAAHVTNDATVTLNVDTLGAKPLRSAPGVELPAGVLVLGTPYVATYYTSNSGEWILHGFYGNPYNTPIGGMMPYLGSTAPNSSFVLPYGQAISRTTYATLFTLVSTTFGVGDGSTTFNVPDVRGRGVVGLDNMGGAAAGRLTTAGSSIDGTTIGAAGGAQTVALVAGNIPSVTVTGTASISPNPIVVPAGATSIQGGAGGAFSVYPVGEFQNIASISVTGTTAAGSTAVNKMPPTIVLPYILRVV